MKGMLTAFVVLVGCAALPETALGAGVLQRHALVVGANYGGGDRPRLHYAVSDAERFGRVLVELGGVAPANEIVLKEPKLRDFLQALDVLTARVAEGRRAAGNGGGRTEVLVYYSGHADEKGLLLGEDRYSYQSLRDRLDQIPADVRIAVLDACASGAFVRIKGGKTRPAFLVDQSSTMRGHAFLTSSSETEAAQESDRIGASYFTHYLVSGLRGAADMSGDGKVTLNEAYQFAFNETLGRTEQTRGGAQHPSYDITMSGSGDVVVTDVRQTSAILVLSEETAGRFFIRNAAEQLVVELYKPAGRKVELGLEPGTYEVRLEREGGSFVGKTQVAEGGRVALDATLFHPTKPEPTRTRGSMQPPTFAVAGRNQIQVALPRSVVGLGQVVQYTRYVREDLGVTFGLGLRGVTGTVTTTVVALPVSLKWNPMRGNLESRNVKPFLTAGFGPVVGSGLPLYDQTGRVVAGSPTFVTFEGQFGAGVDFQVSRSWMIGLSAGYIATRDFPRPFKYTNQGLTWDGGYTGLCIGWFFGRGRGPS